MTERLELEVGDEVAPFEVTPALIDAVRFCGLGWTFPTVFFDVDAARAQGMPGPIVPGPVKLGHIHRALDRWLAGRGFVREVRAAHRLPDLAGRTFTIGGSVTRVYDESGSRRADVELFVVNADGEPSVRGFATVELF